MNNSNNILLVKSEGCRIFENWLMLERFEGEIRESHCTPYIHNQSNIELSKVSTQNLP
jgi:hypothetical protein